MNKTIEKINSKEGYQILPRMDGKDYNCLCKFIEDEWLKRINEFDTRLSEQIQKENISIQDYHCISHNLPHSKLWNKKNRIFDRITTEKVLELSFLKTLKKILGEFEISDEENLGHENIYWRLVRPLPFKDIGGMHRDEWFWEINHQYKEPNYPYLRRKIWIPIYSEIGQNGLLVVPNSQLNEEIEWRSVKIGDSIKPQITSPISDDIVRHLRTKNGEIIVFHDRLLHGGSKNIGAKCRVSLEFTVLINTR